MSVVFVLLLPIGDVGAVEPVEVAAESAEGVAETTKPVSYHNDVLPILRSRCFGCHQGARQLGGYQMTQFASLLHGGESGGPAIVPGDAGESYLIEQISLNADGRAEMPKSPQKPLHENEIETIRQWINEGAANDSPDASGPVYDAAHLPRYLGPPTIASVDLSPDGKTLAASGYHEVVLLDTDSGAIRKRLIGMSPRIESVAFSFDGSRLAAAGGTPGETGELQIWNVETGALELSKTITYDTITGITWSPDDTMIALGCNDNTVRALDSTSGEQVLFQGAHEDWVRDTVFTNDGKHLVTVARDMSCKLTEVATQRFIDNVTSITPGALSGGLSSVAVHPQRDEIVVGGSDGIVKVYRVFRQTARKIGDDANLIRRMPEMEGRVRDVAVNATGTHIAAVATINGHSEVRVWRYDFIADMTKEQKAILAKRVSQRSAKERESIEASRSSETVQTLRFELPDAAAYSLDVTDDGSVWVAANDGRVRHLDPEGKLIAEYPIADFENGNAENNEAIPSETFRANEWIQIANEQRQQQSAREGESDQSPAFDISQVTSLSVTPPAIVWDTPYQYTQLVAIATLSDGSNVDVTHRVEIQPHDAVTIQTGGLIRPQHDATGELFVRLGEHEQTLAFESTRQKQFGVDFIRDVNPVLSRLGCNQGTCHGAQKGKNGFRLSLRGYDPIFDIRALTDDLAARRIDPASPEESMMLRKPLGLTPHEGGTLMTDGDPYHSILRQWITDGSRLDLSASRVESIELFPSNPVVQFTGSRQQVRVLANYTDGSSRDVTHEAFIESGNTDVATAHDGAILRTARRGEAPVLARFEGAYAATTLTVMGDRESYQKPDVPTWNRIDELVAQKWERMKIVPSDMADDATFFRRVHLDLTGLPPTSDAVRAFLADATPTREKRANVVDSLIGNEDYVVYWTNKWADLLQVNRKFLGVEGSKAYHDWIRDAVAENRPYDEFAHQILTASGSNQTNPPASYYKVLRTPEELMENTTHLFLGIRFNCNKCHDHPFERWTQDQYHELAAYFAQVNRKPDPASGERKVGGSAVEQATALFEIIDDTGKTEVQHARTGEPVAPSLPYLLSQDEPLPQTTDAANRLAPTDETLVSATEKPTDSTSDSQPSSRRDILAAWMTDPHNEYFARSYVNRIWGYLTGVGLIEPIDDIRAGNPATNPELLDYLTEEFVRSDFDSRALIRLICNSRTYGLSVETNPLNADDHQNYSHATPRRLPAEVIYDAVHRLTGSTSNLPGMPAGSRAAAATDAGVTTPDGFLANLGRPVRETACECERSDELQLGPVMALISGPTIGAAISDPKNEIEKIITENETDAGVADEIFLRAIGRPPSAAELAAFTSLTSQISSDHDELVARLAGNEQAWQTEFERLEAIRTNSLSQVQSQITARQAEIADELLKLNQQRDEAIKQAEAKLAEELATMPQKIQTWAAAHLGSGTPEWFPIAPTSVSATGDVILRVQPDRSVLASGKADQATYTLDFETGLEQITGFRVEALADPALPGGGPGLPENGNFVVTEIAVQAGPSDMEDPSKLPAQKITSGTADFLQAGFSVDPVFDGNAGNQNAWAIVPATGRDHWATFRFEKPVTVPAQDPANDPKMKTRLRFVISQNHAAKNHLLGRFRISFTTHTGDAIPLSTTENLAIAAASPPETRTDEQTKLLTDYVQSLDTAIAAARTALAEANQPIPADEKLTALQAHQKRLQTVAPVDPELVLLRENVKRSQTQQLNHRLTAAEDLVWALINTPAFLFNH